MIPVQVADLIALAHCDAGGAVVVIFRHRTNRRTDRRFSPGARCAEFGHGSYPEADLCSVGADEGGVVVGGVCKSIVPGCAIQTILHIVVKQIIILASPRDGYLQWGRAWHLKGYVGCGIV